MMKRMVIVFAILMAFASGLLFPLGFTDVFFFILAGTFLIGSLLLIFAMMQESKEEFISSKKKPFNELPEQEGTLAIGKCDHRLCCIIFNGGKWYHVNSVNRVEDLIWYVPIKDLF